MTPDTRIDIAALELHELERTFERLGHARFHARQVFQWMHKRGVTEFAHMTDLSRELRVQLDADLDIQTPQVLRRDVSSDGTTKFLLELADGKQIESVFI